jgi:predicted Zn-dependent peptidase
MDYPIKKRIKGIDVYYIKSTKFKTITWSMVFTHPEGQEKINEYYFISNALVDNMKKYPSNVLKYRYQSKLYGLDAFGSASSVGNNIINNFVVTYPNEKYITEEPELSKKAFIFLNEIVTNPSLRLGKFTKKVYKDNLDEAKELHTLLKSVKDMHAYYKFTKIFYEDKPNLQFNFPENDKLDQITLESFTETYYDLFTKDSVSIFVTGDFDEELFDQIITENLSDRIVNNSVKKAKRVFPYKKDTEPKIKREYDDVSQARIFIGYLTDVEYYSEDHPTLAVMNNIFGGFDQSILFMEIREKNNQAYYVDSNYIPDEQMVVVSISTSFDQEESVIEQTKLILERIQNGDFSEDIFEQAKNNCIHSLEIMGDSQARYLLQHIKSYHLNNERYDLKKRTDLYKKVTKEDVIRVAKSLVLDTVYINTKRGDDNA